MWQSAIPYPLSAVRRRPVVHDAASMVWLQVDAACAGLLRATVIRAGGDAVRFLRIDACARSGAVRALLCVEHDMAPALRQQVMRCLPGCTWNEAPRRQEPARCPS